MTAKIYIDCPPDSGEPFDGMFILTIGVRGVGSVYLVKSWRESGKLTKEGMRRFHFVVQRGYTREDARGTRYWTLHWNPRGPKKGKFKQPRPIE